MSLTVLRVTRQNIVFHGPVSARQSRWRHFTRPCFRPQCHQQRCPGRNDLGVFMRASRNNKFFDVSIRAAILWLVHAHTETPGPSMAGGRRRK